LRDRKRLSAEDLMEALLDTREILCVERRQDTFDEALLNGHEIRKASGAGIVQAQAFPVPQGMIAAPGRL